jgi:hypothetical protein
MIQSRTKGWSRRRGRRGSAYQADEADKRSGKQDLPPRSRLIRRAASYRHSAFLTIQDDPFIAPCCLLASAVQYRRAEPQQDSFSAVEVGFTCGYSGRGLWHPGPRPAGGRKRYTTKRGLTLVNAMHITASVFINDDERGLHADYEKWLEGLALHAPVSQYQHNRTGEDNADAHLKRQVMGR